MADIVLTQEQEIALFEIRTWYTDKLKPTWRLKGYAGTGKTALMKFLIACDDFRTNKQIAVIAYTHKAAGELRKKGVPQAGTIHSLCYKAEELPDGSYSFSRRSKHEVADLYSLIIVDEASMVSKAMRQDIESFGVPVLYVGDAGQLPPIGDDDDGEFMDEAESALIKIHRQAADSPIIRLAHDVRMGKRLEFGRYGAGVLIVREGELNDDLLMMTDQIITGKNETRHYFNKLMRKLKGFKFKNYPGYGERIMVLNNDHDRGLFNGMVLTSNEDQNDFTLKDSVGLVHRCIRPDGVPIQVIKDDTRNPNELELKLYFDGSMAFENANAERHYLKSHGLLKVDFSEAISCHKSQGSSYDKPIIIEEQLTRDRKVHRKWLYTALTRAERKLILARPDWY